MGWSFPWSSSGGKDPETATADTKRRTKPPPKPEPAYGYSDAPQKRVRPIAWNESLSKTDWSEPRHWVPHVIVVSVAFSIWAFYRSYLRRFPGSGYIAPWYFRRRSLLGKVTSVGDGDGFHLFHTPGGRLAGWGWLRRVPSDRKTLKGKTVSRTLGCWHATMIVKLTSSLADFCPHRRCRRTRGCALWTTSSALLGGGAGLSQDLPPGPAGSCLHLQAGSVRPNRGDGVRPETAILLAQGCRHGAVEAGLGDCVRE